MEIDFSRLPEMMNDWVKDIFNNRDRFLVCKGGGGSGKSYGIFQLIIYRMIAEPGHKMLVIRKVGNTLRDSVFSMAKEIISSYGCDGIFKINKSDMTIECTINGNIMLFKGLDDPEKIKSINGITDIVIEEATELMVEDYRQLDIRLRSRSVYPLQMFLLFNPISATHWLKKEFFDNPKSNAITIETTYKDNKFLVDTARETLEAFKETDPYYYSVYALGQWGVTGKTIFNSQEVQERISILKEHYKRKENCYITGYFTYEKEAVTGDDGLARVIIKDDTIRFTEANNGYIKVYKKPEDFTPYVIGVDTAGGNGSDSDNHCAQVINNINGMQIATLKNNELDEDALAEQVYCLGKYYNDALLSVEVNFSTYPQKHLENLGYRNLYLREKSDVIGQAILNKFGFKTNSSTRPALIANLVQFCRESIEYINDIDTLEEMLTFVRNAKGRPEAEQGAHDDTIMALGIAHISRNQQSFSLVISDKKLSVKDYLPSALLSEEDEEEGDDYLW